MISTATRGPALGPWIDALAKRHGHRPALVDGDRALSFADLSMAGRRVAGGLARHGLGRGDRVAIWLPNTTGWIELLIGCARLGAIAVSLNTRFRSAEIGDILSRSGARALVCRPDDGDNEAILREIEPDRLSGLDLLLCDGEAADVPGLPRGLAYSTLAEAAPIGRGEDDPEAGCLILTTSGTTRRPKFVLHAQGGLTRHADDVAAVPGWYGEPDSVGLAIMPLCGAFGLTQTLAALAGGASTILQTGFDPVRAAEAIVEHRVTNMGAVDEVFYRMLAARPEERPFPSLRCVLFGAFNGSPEDFRRIAEPRGIRGVGGYGMSEFQGFFSTQPWRADVARRMRSGGVPASASAAVRVRDTESGDLLASGEVGELEVSAPSMMLEYFGDPDATAAAFTTDGYLRTGDSGRLDGEGGFEFVGRLDDALRLSGFLVSPVEIAAHVERHPSVLACQVVGGHGPEGYRPVAFVIPSGPGIREGELLAHCRSGLAKFKLPTRFVAVEAFPMTDGPNGPKVQRAELRRRADAVLGGAD